MLTVRRLAHSSPRSRRLFIGLVIVATATAACTVGDGKPDHPDHPPADEAAEEPSFTDVAHAYHGLLLDADLEIIETDRRALEAILDSMLESLVSRPEIDEYESIGDPTSGWKKGAAVLDGSQVDEVLGGFEFTADERLLTKVALVQQGIDRAPSQEQVAYRWTFDLVAERVSGHLSVDVDDHRPAFSAYLVSAELLELIRRLRERWFMPTRYIADCRASNVPIPPDWPHGAGWMKQPDNLPWRYNFLQSGTDTEVWTYPAPENRGLCYALPRKDGAQIKFVGIVCQSQQTGKACFWDNIDRRTGQRITGDLRIAALKDGYNLGENCTQCHRGANAFLIHPNTSLGNPLNRLPDVRYSPIGQAAWGNPPAMSEQGTGACAGCHEIGAPSLGYCTILEKAADLTMPSARSPAGWRNPSPPYAAHIAFLKSEC